MCGTCELVLLTLRGLLPTVDAREGARAGGGRDDCRGCDDDPSILARGIGEDAERLDAARRCLCLCRINRSRQAFSSCKARLARLRTVTKICVTVNARMSSERKASFLNPRQEHVVSSDDFPGCEMQLLRFSKHAP